MLKRRNTAYLPIVLTVIAVAATIDLSHILHWPEYMLLLFGVALPVAFIIARFLPSGSPDENQPVVSENPEAEQMTVDMHEAGLTAALTGTGSFSWKKILKALYLGIMLTAGALAANRVLDDSVVQYTTVAVTGKHTGHTKHGGTYYAAKVTIPTQSPLPFSFSGTENVHLLDHAAYDSVVPEKTTLRLRVHEGYLGIPWYETQYELMNTRQPVTSTKVAPPAVPTTTTAKPSASYSVAQRVIDEACAWPKNFDFAHEIGDTPKQNYRIRQSGGVKAEEPIVNGLIHGMAHYVYPNGHIADVSYKQGKMHGHFKVYENTVLIMDTAYKNGHRFGISSTSLRDGRPPTVILWVNDGVNLDIERNLPVSVCGNTRHATQ